MAGRHFGPVGIIDIGSNSVRFVAYAGCERVPANLFNEKTMAALGRGVAKDGLLDEGAMERTLESLSRFRMLAREIGVKRLHVVATAAVRDARNGPEFLKRIAATGLKPRLLSGEEEARFSGLGVVSAIPRAHGVVADLGGGSLELIGVSRGDSGDGVSLPLGVLRLDPNASVADLSKTIAAGVQGSRLMEVAKDRSLYLVGGSFRALAQLDLKSSNHPLPILHQHCIAASRLDDLRTLLRDGDTEQLKKMSGVSGSRLPSLPAALSLLEALDRTLQPRRLVTSAFGLREGILYADLDESVRHQDPLLAAALEVGERLGRFGDHGAALDQWIDPLFHEEDPRLARIRLTACFLADIAWNAHPDFRAERAVDMAVHGNWVGIDAHGRALLGRTLCTAFGGEGGFSPALAVLISDAEARRASLWGRAIRLAQRLSGGTEGLLRRSRLTLSAKRVVLTLPKRNAALYSDAVGKRLKQLAGALGREAVVELS